MKRFFFVAWGCRNDLEFVEDFLQGFAPVHHAPTELLLELGAVEAGVGGAFGWGGVLGCCDGFGMRKRCCCVFFALDADGFSGEVVPGGFTSARGVIDTADSRQDLGEGSGCGGLLATTYDLKGHLGEIAAPCGCTVLVAYDAEVVALAGQLEDGEEEVFACGSVDPGGTEDEVAGSGGGEGFFAGEFGGAVDADGSGGVCFDVGRGAGATEDVVSREVDDASADVAGLFADSMDGFGVDGVGEGGLAFGFVDCSVGAGVDDPSWLHGADGVTDGRGVGKVHDGARWGDDIAQLGQEAQKFATDLSGCAGEEDRRFAHVVLIHVRCNCKNNRWLPLRIL